MTQPWLSVLMPVHDGADYLDATLASALIARPEGVEFLIYDSSADGTCRAIVSNYTAALNIRYAAMPDVKSWTEKTNLAASGAQAPYLALLHQDDIWLPDHLQAARQSMNLHPDAVMSVASSQFINQEGKVMGKWSLPMGAGLYSGTEFGRQLLVQNVLAIPSPFIRRDAWLAVAGMESALWYTADWDLYLKLAKLGSVAVRPQATTAFRIHGGSLTMKGSRDAQALRDQLNRVLVRHGTAFGLDDDKRLRARATASVDVNCALAMAAAGQKGWILRTLMPLWRLGPIDALRYIHEARLIDRVLPRLRARFSGAL